MFFAIGVIVGRFAPKWLSESAWQTVTEMIAGAMKNTQTVAKTYLTAFSVSFAAEMLIILVCFSFAALPIMMLFFLCSGIGVGAAMTAYFSLFQGHGLLFGAFVLGPQMIGTVCTCILLAEMALKATNSLILRMKSEKNLDFDSKSGYHIAVKILTFTAVLALCALYYAVMKHYFAPVLPY